MSVFTKFMPTYDYYCEKCKDHFEAFQSMRDDAYAICPREKCLKKRWGKGKVRRLLGAGAGLIFKGSGFYITDYRSDSYQAAAKKDSEAGKSSSDKAGTKKDATKKASDSSTKTKPSTSTT